MRLEQRPFDLGSITLIMRPSQHLRVSQPHEPLESLPCVKHGFVQCATVCYFIQGFYVQLICNHEKSVQKRSYKDVEDTPKTETILFFVVDFGMYALCCSSERVPADFVITNSD